MKEQSGHITSKVILGYILLITIAVCSVAYIYNIVEKVAEEDEPDHQARRKVYLVTNTLSLLYESEALGQLACPRTSSATSIVRRIRPIITWIR